MRSYRSFQLQTFVVFATVAAALSANAQIYTAFSGAANSPTWTRPQPDGLSVSTVTTRYGLVAFKVGTSGNFSILGETHGTFDLVELLYDNSFNPATPLAGFLKGSNVSGFGGAENLASVPLTSNTLYYAVGTGFNASDGGPIVFTFSGPSSATQIFLPPLPGDYNQNGAVDAADYVRWRDTLNSSVSFFSGADGNGSGTIDNGDYNSWRTNFGRTTGSGSNLPNALPEPASLVVTLFLPLFAARLSALSGRRA